MMKVLMIGDSHVGKTTYMAAMYKLMADDDKICIRANNSEDAKTLERFGEELFSRGIYPDKTALKSNYRFSLDIRSNSVQDFHFFYFSWIDSPGEAIYQRTTEPIPAELARDLNEVDSLVVFLDFTTLNAQENSKVMRQWNRIKQFMLKFAGRAREDQPLTLTIILTKADVDVDFDLENAPVWNKLCEFINSIRNNQSLFGMLALSGINQQSLGNVYFTFMYSMLMGMLNEAYRQIKIIENRTFLERLKYMFIDDQTMNRLNLLKAYLEVFEKQIKEYSGFGEDKGGYILF
ncbi:MAG: hypothetical protein Q4D38_12110 [Planctomycetia bacterium]|nr:hypothetical protein [Planctomycetia bacterium]